MPIPPEYVATFGVAPEHATHWSCSRLAPGAGPNDAGEVLVWRDALGVGVRDWPLAELAPQTIRQRWGAGSYRIGWIQRTPEGRRRAAGRGRHIDLSEDGATNAATNPTIAPSPPSPLSSPSSPVVHHAIPVAPAADLLAGLQVAQRFGDLVDARASSQIEGLAKLAQIMMGREDREAARADKQAKGEIGALLAAIQQLDANNKILHDRLAALEADDDDEANESPAAGPFTAGPLGEQLQTMIANVLVSQGPAIIDKLLPALLDRLNPSPSPPPSPPPPSPLEVTVDQRPSRPSPSPDAPDPRLVPNGAAGAAWPEGPR